MFPPLVPSIYQQRFQPFDPMLYGVLAWPTENEGRDSGAPFGRFCSTPLTWGFACRNPSATAVSHVLRSCFYRSLGLVDHLTVYESSPLSGGVGKIPTSKIPGTMVDGVVIPEQQQDAGVSRPAGIPSHGISIFPSSCTCNHARLAAARLMGACDNRSPS